MKRNGMEKDMMDLIILYRIKKWKWKNERV